MKSPTEGEERWSPARKALFRLAFSYLALYLLPLSATVSSSFGWLFRDSKAVAAYEALWTRAVPWFGAHILRLRDPITIIGRSVDSTFENVKLLAFALIAVLATVVWSAIDRRRVGYSKLDQWLRLYLRVALACTLFVYGCQKLIPAQMLPPNLSTLIQPFGDLTPYRLLWSAMGASPAYQMFAGAIEVLGGILLLIPTTTTLGALVSLGAMVNVFLLDMFYDVPVKLWALHLVLLAVFLLLPDLRRLVNALVLNRPVEPERRAPLFHRPWANRALWVLQWVLGLYVMATAFADARTLVHHVRQMPRTNPVYGIWRVVEFSSDGQVRPPFLTDDLRWQRVIFDSEPSTSQEIVATIQEMNGRFAPYVATIDTSRRALSLVSPRKAELNGFTAWIFSAWISMNPAGQDRSLELSYQRSEPDLMTVEGVMDGHRLRVTLEKEHRQFVLQTRGFSWINDEYDLFNDRVVY